jgi:hypothetical protein
LNVCPQSTTIIPENRAQVKGLSCYLSWQKRPGTLTSLKWPLALIITGWRMSHHVPRPMTATKRVMEDGRNNTGKQSIYVSRPLPHSPRKMYDSSLPLVLIAPVTCLKLQLPLRILHLFRKIHCTFSLSGKSRYGCCNRCAEEVMATRELRRP